MDRFVGTVFGKTNTCNYAPVSQQFIKRSTRCSELALSFFTQEFVIGDVSLVAYRPLRTSRNAFDNG